MRILKMFLAILILFGISATGNAEETIRLASGEWPPYQSENLRHCGVASRIVTEAFALGGVRVEYGYFPWNRSLNIAKRGKWDGTFLWFDTPERRKDFHISDSVVDIQYVFFHLKSYPFEWSTIEDLKGIRIGGTLGYDYGESFQNAEKKKEIRVRRSNKDKLILKNYSKDGSRFSRMILMQVMKYFIKTLQLKQNCSPIIPSLSEPRLTISFFPERSKRIKECWSFLIKV